MLAITLFIIIFTFICLFTHDYNPTIGFINGGEREAFGWTKAEYLDEAALGMYLRMYADAREETL